MSRRPIAFFEPMVGASGDMFLGALVDAGAPFDEIVASLRKLDVPDFEMSASVVDHRGFRCTKLEIEVPHEHHHRHLSDIRTILDSGVLPERVVANALRVFQRLAEAEGRVHGIAPEQVHFHEVGALDSILDIAGSVFALSLLEVSQVWYTPPRVGSGEIDSAHGKIPVPAPAVVELMQGIPIVRTSIPTEILTPTGAALLTTLGKCVPEDENRTMIIRTIGTSCGSKELPDRANVLRVSLVDSVVADLTRGVPNRPTERPPIERPERSSPSSSPWEEDEIWVLETNLDDMSAEWVPTVIERVLADGALDAYVTPVLMKKGRPGFHLTVLCESELHEKIAARIFQESTTFGIRRSCRKRWKLARKTSQVRSRWGPIVVKVGDLGGGRARVTPEFESCREISERAGIPLGDVYREAEELIRQTEWNVASSEAPTSGAED